MLNLKNCRDAQYGTPDWDLTKTLYPLNVGLIINFNLRQTLSGMRIQVCLLFKDFYINKQQVFQKCPSFPVMITTWKLTSTLSIYTPYTNRRNLSQYIHISIRGKSQRHHVHDVFVRLANSI